MLICTCSLNIFFPNCFLTMRFYYTCFPCGFSKLVNRYKVYTMLYCQWWLFSTCKYKDWNIAIPPFSIIFDLFANLNLYMTSDFCSMNEDLRSVGTGLKYCSWQFPKSSPCSADFLHVLIFWIILWLIYTLLVLILENMISSFSTGVLPFVFRWSELGVYTLLST